MFLLMSCKLSRSIQSFYVLNPSTYSYPTVSWLIFWNIKSANWTTYILDISLWLQNTRLKNLSSVFSILASLIIVKNKSDCRIRLTNSKHNTSAKTTDKWSLLSQHLSISATIDEILVCLISVSWMSPHHSKFAKNHAASFHRSTDFCSSIIKLRASSTDRFMNASVTSASFFDIGISNLPTRRALSNLSSKLIKMDYLPDAEVVIALTNTSIFVLLSLLWVIPSTFRSCL